MSKATADIYIRTIAASNDNCDQAVMRFHCHVIVLRLQSTKRTGWVNRGVDQPESIADHMYRMGMMGLICGADAETTMR